MKNLEGGPVAVGEVLDGKFRVENVLGVGGMGVVVAATHLTLNELVALKFLLKDTIAKPEVVARFLREAQAAARIKSEHVARVTDVGTLQNGAPYMVMEHLIGRDLEQVLEAKGPLPIETAVGFMLEACEAIAEAHSLGIVHRDLKPSNLFLARRTDGSTSVKVLDFGISKAIQADEAAAALTQTQSAMGSPLYMSPEQMRSARRVDHRTDIWSLGVVLFQLLTESYPFLGETWQALVVSITIDQAVKLREKLPNAPAQLEAVLLKCLAKDPDQRYSTVADLVEALMPFAPASGQLSHDRITRLLRGGGVPSAFLESGLSQPPRAPSLATIDGDNIALDVQTAASPQARGAAVRGAPVPALQKTSQPWAETLDREDGGEKKSSSKLWIALGAVAALAIAGVGFKVFSGSSSATGAPTQATTSPPPPAADTSTTPTTTATASTPIVAPVADSATAPTPSASVAGAVPDAGSPKAKPGPGNAHPQAKPPSTILDYGGR